MRSRPEGPAPPAKPDIAPAVRRDVNGPRCLLVPEPPLCWMGKKGRSAMSAQPRGVRAKRRGYALTTNFTLDSSSLGVAHRMRSAGFGSGGHSRFSERKRRHPRGDSPGASRALGSAGTATSPRGSSLFTRRTKSRRVIRDHNEMDDFCLEEQRCSPARAKNSARESPARGRARGAFRGGRGRSRWRVGV